MRTKAGDIYCERGETFTIGFDVRGNDGAPYVLSSKLEGEGFKAYLLLTVASSANVTESERKVYNFWGDTSNIDKFYTTKPLMRDDVGAVGASASDAWTAIYNSYTKELDESATTINPANYAIYYKEDDDGTRTYRRITGTDANTAKWADYKFLYYKHFSKAITEQWVESQYDYALKVVSGTVIEGAKSEDRPIIVNTSYPILSVHSIYIDTNVRGSINAVDGSKNYKEV